MSTTTHSAEAFGMHAQATKTLWPIRARIEANISMYNRALKKFKTTYPGYPGTPVELVDRPPTPDDIECDLTDDDHEYLPMFRAELTHVLEKLAERSEPVVKEEPVAENA